MGCVPRASAFVLVAFLCSHFFTFAHCCWHPSFHRHAFSLRWFPIFQLPKTGTTFLQCALCAYANTTEPILLSDNWVFLGTCPYQVRLRLGSVGGRSVSFPGSGHCSPSVAYLVQPLSAKSNISFLHSPIQSCGLEEHPQQFLPHDIRAIVSRTLVVFRSFAERVKALRQQNRNVLVVFEGCVNMADDQIRALASFLRKEDWDVQVLVAYRPLYEWLPSKYNSVTKRMYRLYAWPGQPSEDDSNRPGEHWLPFDPRHGGNDNVLGTLLHEINSTRQHPAETVLHMFAAYLSVSVIPLHNLPPPPSPDVDPLLAYLFCTILGSSSPRGCKAVRAKRIGNDIPSNPSDPINYDMLATAAYEAGILDPALDRETVERRIQRRQQRVLHLTALDFPLTCLPNQTLSEFESLSWQLERQMFPEYPYEEAWEKHQQGFARKVASKSFCWIDTNKTLSDPSWRSFLKSGILT